MYAQNRQAKLTFELYKAHLISDNNELLHCQLLLHGLECSLWYYLIHSKQLNFE